MSSQQITIELPEAVMRQLMRIAAATQQPIEALVTQSVLSNLPPPSIMLRQNCNLTYWQCSA